MARADEGLAIGNAIAKLYRRSYGRGPATVRTVTGRDQVVVFLEDIYTTVERTLIERGEFEAVRTTRKAFQQTMRDAFVAEVEQITGRSVIAFMSEVHASPDVAVEVFVLERAG